MKLFVGIIKLVEVFETKITSLPVFFFLKIRSNNSKSFATKLSHARSSSKSFH